ncbi:hypothetical protein [Halalkalibacter alkaliphilus]|uniref:Uncharacterized protein n=1 Tax=Halalkalibacter alkaliphilus TaxID=2917993 RepID=A0A9X1ZUA1_9BACI|nr:hypothetical protein [Halalkalibacter alkaliphilus]MCL7745629.1 hypothetical protein [Halalkalibacter alkaliphilus]
MFNLNTLIKEDGLYFVKIKAKTIDSKVMPTKQFIAGSLSEEDIDSLPSKRDEGHHESHH